MRCSQSIVSAVIAFLVLGAATFASQEFILETIHPGKSTSAEMRAQLGEPVKTEAAGDLTVQHFDPKDKLLKEITCWFDARGVLQWARLQPVNKIGPEDAALLFTARGTLEVVPGNVFSDAQATQSKTWLHRASGIHWVVLDNAVEEMWFTLPNADPAQILSRIKRPVQASTMAAGTTLKKETAALGAQPAAVRNPLTEIRPAIRGSRGPSFLGLEVGRSTRADVEAVLGAFRQASTSAEGKKSTVHDGGQAGLREVLVWYAAGDVIEVISLVPIHPASPAELASALGLEKPDRILPYGASYLHCFDAAGVRFALEGNNVGMITLILEQPPVSPAATPGRQPAEAPSADAVSRGRELVGQQKYTEAIEYFKSALKLSPKDAEQGLAVCYYHLGDFKTADENAGKAYRRDKKDPVSVFYAGATRDARNKTREAIYLYKAYLKLRYNNESMNNFARNRLAALESSSPKASETFMKALDAIFKQIP